MLLIEKKTNLTEPIAGSITLSFELRCKNRLRTHLDSGELVGLFLERGTVLRGGDRLQANDGRIIQVLAASELVIIARSQDTCLLSRAAYHLGNRHVPVEVRKDLLIFQKDHVLAEMVQGLGLIVEEKLNPFEPESGAYGNHVGHAHGHSSDGLGRGARIHDMRLRS